MSEDGTVILKSRYLENLEIGEHEFRVSYRLGDYEYEHDDEKLLSDTSFKVKVENAAIDNGNDNNSDDGNDNNNGKQMVTAEMMLIIKFYNLMFKK